MALQYLDGQTIQYQVVLRNGSGDYQAQYPQSSSLMVAADGFIATPVSGQNNLSALFSNIDWASCVPPAEAYATTEEIMTYLSSLFTGQQGTLIPPAVSLDMIFSTQPMGALDISNIGTATFYIPLNGFYLPPSNAPYAIEEAQTPMMIAGTFAGDCLSLYCSIFSCDQTITIRVLKNLIEYGAVLDITANGIFLSAGPDLEFVPGDTVCLQMDITNGTGTAIVSCIASVFTEVPS